MNNKNHKTLLKCDKENSKNILFIKQISSIIKENEKKYPKIVYFAIIEFIHINNYQKISQELIIEYFKKNMNQILMDSLVHLHPKILHLKKC
jgi:flagellar biosynthesis component FlhA